MLSPHPNGVVWGKLRTRLLSTSAKYKLISTSVRDAEALGEKIVGLCSIRNLKKSEKKAALSSERQIFPMWGSLYLQEQVDSR